MRVGLNLIFLVPGETGGMEVAARELVPALRAAAPGVELVGFFNREAQDDPLTAEVEAVTVPVRARNRVEWVRGEQQHLPRLARRAGVDVLHSLASTAPLWGAFARVVTVHDLIFRLHPEAHQGLRTRGMGLLVPLAARRSDRVIAVSRSTRDDLVRHVGIAAAKVDVVPQGMGAPARADPVPEARLRERHALGSRAVVLSVSAKRPHKNLARLLEALALIAPERRPALVLPGYPTWHETELRERARALGVEGDVRFLGWIDAAELEGLYALAAAFVFPSLYEGFGLPVLEAMSRGVPVATSDRSSLPEVAGDAALLFDPLSPRAIATAMETLLGDAQRAERLRAAGRRRAAQFTWEATAAGTLDSYERALRAPSS
ncbi:MAG TPA: glycosyltransferase family 1 protein [Solirubrobacteraceae bacterium]|nr:glycosyltransferase family 1 protein [Solirubrobacteraceae bacterium]